MRNRVLVVGKDIAWRAQLARTLNAAGHGVELADSIARVTHSQRRSVALALVAQDAARREPAQFSELQRVLGRALLVSAAPGPQGSNVLDPADEATLLASIADALFPAAPPEGRELPLQFSGFQLDVAGRSLFDGAGGEVPLTRSEFDLLRIFLDRPGRVLSRDFLLQSLSGREAEAFDRSVDMLIMRLRRKVEVDPKHPSLIVTVPGSGYKFAGKVSQTELATVPGADTPTVVEEATPSVRERRHVTVLNAALISAGGDNLGSDPEEFSAFISRYRDEADRIVATHGGVVGHRVGGEVIAYFSYPVAQENAAERAIRTGLALVEQARTDARMIAAQLSVRVGIASGLVVADPAGEMLGETPSEAMRLQALADMGHVVVAASTQRLAGNLFSYRALARSPSVSGNGLVDAAEVIGASTVSSRSEALYGGVPPPLVGRQEELDLLRRAWQHVSAGEGRVVLLSGEPGIGKSRLLVALQQELALSPQQSLRYFCSPLHRDSALHPVIARWTQEAGFSHADCAQERARKLNALLAAEELAPGDTDLIAALLSIPAAEADTPSDMSPQRRKELTFAMLRRRLIAMARRQPILILFEDAHWADSSSLELLDAVVELISQYPIMLVISLRPQFVPSWVGRAGVSLIALSRLNPRQAAALASHVAGARTLPAPVLERIVARADGVPLFIEELTKALLESGILADRDSDEGIARLSRLTVPATLQALIMGRLDRLPAAKRVAQIGAAIGSDFSHDLLYAATEMPAAAVVEGLAELLRSGLVQTRGTPPDAHYSFKHALVRDAAYDSLLRADRRRLHGRIALTLEQHDPAGIEPEILARHCSEAGFADKAVSGWLRAGLSSLRRGAMTEALAQLDRALAAIGEIEDSDWRRARELELWIARIKALMAAEGHAAPSLREAFERARALCSQLRADAQFVTLVFGQWSVAFVRGDLAAAGRQVDELIRLAESQGDAVYGVIAHYAAGMTLLPRGVYADARRHFLRGIELFEEDKRGEYAAPVIGDPRVMMRLYLAWGLLCEGCFAAARDQRDSATDEARHLGQRWTLAQTLSIDAFLALTLDSPETALDRLDELETLAHDHDFAYWQAIGKAQRGWCVFLAGDAERGGALLRAGIDALRKSGTLIWVPSLIRVRAEALAALGRFAEAHRCLDESVRLAVDAGALWDLAEMFRVRGELFALDGDDQAAAEELTKAAAQARGLDARLFELRAAMSLAHLAARQGRPVEAEAVLAPVVRRFDNERGSAVDLDRARRSLRSLEATSEVRT